jgi:peptide/nickel transport system substrate-binding protein
MPKAKAAGIEINVVREPNDSYWDNVWLKKPWSLCYWGGRPTADAFLSISLAADAAWNDTNWKNPRFNELLLAARAETDDVARAMYLMQAICSNQGGTIIPMFASYIMGLTDKPGTTRSTAGRSTASARSNAGGSLRSRPRRKLGPSARGLAVWNAGNRGEERR